MAGVPRGAARQAHYERKRLFIIDNMPLRVQKAQAAMGDLYDVAVFSDGGRALQAMYEHPPHVALVDQRTMSTQGRGVHRTKCTDDKLKHIPFIIMSDVHEGPFLAGTVRGPRTTS